MAEKIKEYKSEEITIIWKPEKCIHSENCFRGLSDVFDPKARPWINVNGASDKKIKGTIDNCPSGALSYKKNGDSESEPEIEEGQNVEVTKDGPLMVYGNLMVKNHDGSETTKHRITAFCRCGASANKPYCDGSHKAIDFKG